jgi:hypothetical protein
VPWYEEAHGRDRTADERALWESTALCCRAAKHDDPTASCCEERPMPTLAQDLSSIEIGGWWEGGKVALTRFVSPTGAIELPGLTLDASRTRIAVLL